MDGIWIVFFRGIIFGFLGDIVLIVLFLGSGKYGSLAGIRPIGFLYFLAGLEIGIALIGAIAFFGLQAFHDWGQRELERSKSRKAEKRRHVIAARLAGRFLGVPVPNLPAMRLLSHVHRERGISWNRTRGVELVTSGLT